MDSSKEERTKLEERLLVRRLILKPDLILCVYSHPNQLEIEVTGPNNTYVVITLNGDMAGHFVAAVNEVLQTINRKEDEPVH